MIVYMLPILILEKIEECYKKNESLHKLLKKRYVSNLSEKVLIELNDYILTNNEIYESNNLSELIYEAFYEINNSRFTHFIRNMVNEHPDRDRTYSHMINDIKESLITKYNLPKEYYKMSKNDLNKECDRLFTEGKYLQLGDTRKFINDNFPIDDYKSFVFENRDLARKILKNTELDETDRVYVRIKSMLQRNMGYLGLFTYYNKVEKVGFGLLKSLFMRMMENKDILNQLPKPVVSYMSPDLERKNFKGTDGRTYTKHFENLNDDLTTLELKREAKKFSNEYPGELKYKLDENPDFIEIVKTIMEDEKKYEMYKKYWIKKVSRYKTQEELIDSLTNFAFSDSSSENIRKQVNNDYNLKLVFDDGEIMVVRVLSYDAIQTIGGDTSWCIKDSLSYWTSYVSGSNVQLVIMDFGVEKTSRLRKIGVTLYDGGSYNTGHNISDGYISEMNVNAILEKAGTNLKEMYNVARDLGSNEYYDDEDISSDSYGGY